MSEPYYRDDKVTLYLGDCREVTEWLDAGVLVTDPPYGINWEGNRVWRPVDGSRVAAHAGIANDGDTVARDKTLDLWGQPPALVFGSLYAPFPSGVVHVLIMQKQFSTGLMGKVGFRRDIEGVFLVGKWPKSPAIRSSVIRTATLGPGGELSIRTGHPHAKPLDVMEQLIDACPPGVIADPFAGSGSTLVAARNLGRRAIGVEIEESYCEVIAKRLAQDCLDLGETA